jgi:hypothetical protein
MLHQDCLIGFVQYPDFNPNKPFFLIEQASDGKEPSHFSLPW